MRITILLFLWLTAGSLSAQTNQTLACCRHPVRIFGDHATVNLTPLFRWWTQHEHSDQLSAGGGGADPSRPLAAWHRITGTKAGELEYSWFVDAVIYTSPGTRTNARIILKNPPVAEAGQLATLKSELAAAGQQIANDQRTYQADVKAAQKATARAQTGSRSNSNRTRQNAANYTQQAAQENAAAAAAQNEQKQLEQASMAGKNQLAAIPVVKGKYQIDWFAMAAGRNKDGVPIYDVGAMPAGAP